MTWPYHSPVRLDFWIVTFFLVTQELVEHPTGRRTDKGVSCNTIYKKRNEDSNDILLCSYFVIIAKM